MYTCDVAGEFNIADCAGYCHTSMWLLQAVEFFISTGPVFRRSFLVVQSPSNAHSGVTSMGFAHDMNMCKKSFDCTHDNKNISGSATRFRPIERQHSVNRETLIISILKCIGAVGAVSSHLPDQTILNPVSSSSKNQCQGPQGPPTP